MWKKAGSLAVRRGLQLRYPQSVALPEYMDQAEVEALIRCASHARAALLMLLQWRAGLRVSEAVAIERRDVRLDGERPTLMVRRGKGGKARVVPVHPELAAALRNVMAFAHQGAGPLVQAHRVTGWKWVQAAYQRARALGGIQPGRRIGTHTLRHSAARHWLLHGIPINVVQRWLGHASLDTTLIYLQVLPDPMGDIGRVP